MQDLKMKEKILDEIMSLMDEKEVDGLKKKSPKFMKVEIEAASPMKKEEGEKMAPEMEMEDDGMEKELDDESIKELLKSLM